MSVADLIEKLRAMDPDAPVVLWDSQQHLAVAVDVRVVNRTEGMDSRELIGRAVLIDYDPRELRSAAAG